MLVQVIWKPYAIHNIWFYGPTFRLFQFITLESFVEFDSWLVYYTESTNGELGSRSLVAYFLEQNPMSIMSCDCNNGRHFGPCLLSDCRWATSWYGLIFWFMVCLTKNLGLSWNFPGIIFWLMAFSTSNQVWSFKRLTDYYQPLPCGFKMFNLANWPVTKDVFFDHKYTFEVDLWSRPNHIMNQVTSLQKTLLVLYRFIQSTTMKGKSSISSLTLLADRHPRYIRPTSPDLAELAMIHEITWFGWSNTQVDRNKNQEVL